MQMVGRLSSKWGRPQCRSCAGLRPALKSSEYPRPNISFDLADRPRCVDDKHVLGRASGVYENIVEPPPPIHGSLNTSRVSVPLPSRRRNRVRRTSASQLRHKKLTESK